jgi:oxygen-independent coproporphyrinogen-3 oxidase
MYDAERSELQGPREIFRSELVARAQERLATLPLAEAAVAGFVRDRENYFLNIAYPSVQAMDEKDEGDIYPMDQNEDIGRDVALYVHVPFCAAGCYYCHYFKDFKQSTERVEEFLDGVEGELELHSDRLGPIRARSVYIGGGTPSYLVPAQIERLFKIVRSNVEILDGAEVSFEVHPESADPERFASLQSSGVNRINIGVESFDNSLLAAENRRHTSEEAIKAIRLARALGVFSVNIDLIYGLKGQTIHTWESTLDTVASLEPDSATMYYLRLKRKTPEHSIYKRHPERFPTEEDVLLMHAMNFERMEGELGYTQNPVDWFIRNPSYFHTYQDHNWRRSDETELLGIGPSAYSYMNGSQYYNVNHTQRYLDSVKEGRVPVWRGERLGGEERMRRTVMLGIKMGMDRPAFEAVYGVDVVDAFQDQWKRMEELGLINIKSKSVDLTYMGKLLADEVGQSFYSENMVRRMKAIDPDMISTTWPWLNT